MKKQFPSCILAEIEQQCCLLLAKLLPAHHLLHGALHLNLEVKPRCSDR